MLPDRNSIDHALIISPLNFAQPEQRAENMSLINLLVEGRWTNRDHLIHRFNKFKTRV